MENQSDSPYPGLNTFHHVVVLMLENRSFDNLLGNLFKHPNFKIPEGKSFAGLQDQNLSNPVPTDANGYDNNPMIKIHRPTDHHQPFPDPGEVYQHINTQIYNCISPGNSKKEPAYMVAPFNIPDPLPSSDQMMKGFIKDYINTQETLWIKKLGPDVQLCPHERAKLEKLYDSYKNPDVDHYKVIMSCFEPDQVPVLSTLATSFAVFDHWHCAVPSQTWCNRAFWHAGTSGGKVVNPSENKKGEGLAAMKSWMDEVWSQPTLFDLLEAKKISHAVYGDPLTCVTHLVHGFSHHINQVTNSFDPWLSELDAFKRDINNKGKRPFPEYSFIEPKFIGQHNDQHPSSVASGPFNDDGNTREGTVRLGEELIRRIYDIIRDSPHRHDTLFIITHDEHGGCFDHVVPGSAVPPTPDQEGEKGFNFDRLGIRVPMVMVSSYIKENTIVNETFDHSSFIKTMSKKWSLDGLQDRDQSDLTNTFENIFTSERREWPEIPEAATPMIENKEEDYHAHPINGLQSEILSISTSIAQINKQKKGVPIDADPLAKVETVKDAIDYLTEIKPWLY